MSDGGHDGKRAGAEGPLSRVVAGTLAAGISMFLGGGKRSQ